MANLDFITALSEQKRRNELTNRPEYKMKMDEMLKQGSVNRLLSSKNNMSPLQPAANEIVRGFSDGRTPGSEPGGLGWGGESLGPNAVDLGVVDPSTAYGIEDSFAEGMGFSGNRGNYTMSIPGFLSQYSPVSRPVSLLSNIAYDKFRDWLSPPEALEPPGAATSEGGFPGGVPGADTATAGPEGQGVGPIGGGVEGFGPSGPGPAGSLGGETASESAAAAGGDGGGADGGTVLCTELYRQGKLDRVSYWADSAYGRTVDDETLIGYRLWAEPLAKAMSQSVVLTSILEPFVRSWAYEMAYRVGQRTSGNRLGAFLGFLGVPLCKFIGKSMNYKPTNRTRNNTNYVTN